MNWYRIRAVNRYQKSLSDDRIDVEPKWGDEINEDEIREWLEFRGKQPH